MTMLVSLGAGLFSTLLTGSIAYYIFKHFASDTAARIGAFWLAVGAAGARYSYSGPLSDQAALALSALVGAALAITILWVWLLRSSAGGATRDRL